MNSYEIITTNEVPAPRAIGRHLRRALLSLLATLSAIIGLNVTSAAAFTHATSGSAGWVTPSQVVGTAFQVPCYTPGGSNCFQPAIRVDGPLAYRSPATTGLQRVTLRTVVYRWSNGWYPEITDDQVMTLNAGVAYGRFGNRGWMPNTSGAKTVTHVLQWTDSTGRLLGTRAVSMNTAGDYICQTSVRGCTASTYFVSIGIW